MNLLRRIFGHQRHPRPEPTAEDVAGVDLDRMIAIARERGDRRTDAEVVAALHVGADTTADRHPDEALRRRAAAAALAARAWLVDRVGEEEALRLFSRSAGPVDEQGRTVRRPG